MSRPSSISPRATDLPLAIRSGGHSTVGHSGTDGGLVIDLRDLNSIEIDAETETAWCGTGMTAGAVTDAVQMHGFIVGFGDSATVGIGGLTLGGGIGYLVRKHGLTIDPLVAAEVVTAAGDIVIADETSHPDLFWALRGGGGNFGVVTRLKYKLHRLPAFTGGPLVLPANPDVVAAFAKAAEAAPDELSTIGMVMTAPPLPFLPPEVHGRLIFMCLMAYAGSCRGCAARWRRSGRWRRRSPISSARRRSAACIFPRIQLVPAVTMSTMFADSVDRDDVARMIDLINAHDAPVRAAQNPRAGRGDGTGAGRGDGLCASQCQDHAELYGDGLCAGRRAAQCRMDQPVPADHGLPGHRRRLCQLPRRRGYRTASGPAYPPETLRRLRQVKRKYDPRTCSGSSPEHCPGLTARDARIAARPRVFHLQGDDAGGGCVVAGGDQRQFVLDGGRRCIRRWRRQQVVDRRPGRLVRMNDEAVAAGHGLRRGSRHLRGSSAARRRR